MNDNDLRDLGDLPLPTTEDVLAISDYLIQVAEGLEKNPKAVLSPTYGPNNLTEAAHMLILYGHRVQQLRKVIDEKILDRRLHAALNGALDRG